MIDRIIEWSLGNRLAVIAAAVILAVFGIYSASNIRLDAIPDISDLQVIIKTSYPGQSPEIVEDQVTYPLTSALLAVPGSTAVRGFSMFGESYLYVLFKDGTDPYWARSRVLEYISQATSRLPQGVVPALGPDASGVGWVFSCAAFRTSILNTSCRVCRACRKWPVSAAWCGSSRSRLILTDWQPTS
jgi:copper/silver efflux system protein